MFVLVLIACQEPFGTDRHDLVADRIAAITAPIDAGVVRPRAAVVADGHLWSEEPLAFAWSWVADAEDAAEPPAAAIAAGPAPEIPVADGFLALHVTFADGGIARAVITPSEELVSVDTIALETVTRTVSAVTAADLARDERLTWEAEPATAVPEDGFGRLSATGAPEIRWMATAGTIFELDATTADWAAGEIALDDEDVILGEALPQGLITVLALGLGGANDFHAREIPVGEPPLGVYTTSQRFLPGDAAPAGLVQATLVADDGPTGLALQGAIAITDLPAEDPYGTEALACTSPVSGPFDPSWLLDGRCARSQVVGATVVLEIP